ncbi:U3 small nucleolar RNA-associated protein 21 [Sphaceloma murrayae]|uniref:U3 small nucleolar RNA-associated protein 21 n=1 Tax=Sphaceloma murrayae TaxID=2082308 RepID=A0A2K1QI94_9PEZI|nr:U3 small nucleolar RNA-associated protein 21 [Sphaceloma murrayae]
MADLQELFSMLKSSSTANQQNAQSSQQAPLPFPHIAGSYQQPSVSSPIFSPPAQTPNPSGSGILSPKVATPAQDTKAANLLNLLRFNGQPQQSSPLTDLQNVANTSKSLEHVHPGTIAQSRNESGPRTVTSPSSNPQNFLLNLLNQPRKTTEDSSPQIQAPQPRPMVASQSELMDNLADASVGMDGESKKQESRETTPMRVFGQKSRETTPFEVASAQKGSGIFTYVNPFEKLSASTPKRSTPKPETPVQPAAGPVNPNKRHAVESAPDPPAEAAPLAMSNPPAAVAVSAAISGAKSAIKQESEEVPESWQTSKVDSDVVQVHNLPMRPFTSITVHPTTTNSTFKPEGIMDIVRLKKEFDQVDRTLATASRSHIAYAMSRSGGFRIIRQDSGRDKQVFKSNPERVFHIQVSEGPEKMPRDTVLAAGVNGSVFWTKVDLSVDEKWADQDLEAHGFVLPAVSAQEENTSGSPVKTRSKLSSRHQDIFALSRGKSIHIVAPEIAGSTKYTDAKTRVVDTEKYFQERNLKITTGKACKDFTFSEDDSTIASLDKAGRVRFWDVRELSEAARSPKNASMELKTPLMTLNTSIGSDKVSPTSIMFVDKERPITKGVALRYLLLGTKQNHVISLVDISLQKVVQELHFPHDSDSDAICSLAYHPKSGIISLAHPTRNSVYFIHLSAPRYHIPAMDQAKFTSMLASEDPALPKPESTAIMSGIREIKLGSKGQIRSVDMLRSPASTSPDDSRSEEVLFELYAMHSTGVTCLSVRKADLGWGYDNKVLSPHDAEKEGSITISPITVPAVAEASVASETPARPKTIVKSEPVKNASSAQPKIKNALTEPVVAQKTVVQSIELPESKAMPKANPPLLTPDSYAMAASRTAGMAVPEVASPDQRKPDPAEKPSVLVDRTKKNLTNGDAVNTGNAGASQIASLITSELDTLYKRIEEHRRVQDIAASTRQQGVLQLVSETLTDNVERSLAKIVSTSLQQELLPAVADVFSALAERRLAEHLHESVGNVVPQEVRAALPSALATALRDEETIRMMSGPIASDLSQKVLQTMEGVVRKTIAPTISQTITTSVQKAVQDSEERLASQRGELDTKFDRLANLIYGLSENLQQVTASQAALQDQVSSLQKQLEMSRQPSRPATAAASAPASASTQDPELDEITEMMKEGRFEEATIRWLQSSRQAELFDRLFVRVNPQYLQKLSPLVKLSVSAAVSTSFEENVDQRLDWLGIILHSTDLQDTEIVSVAPKIMNVLLSRIQGAYMTFAERDPADPVLRKFSGVSKQITEIGRVLG